MDVDLDPFLDIDQSLESLPSYLLGFADLSIACMEEDLEDRPTGEYILEKVQSIWTECTYEELQRQEEEQQMVEIAQQWLEEEEEGSNMLGE
jgi:hypothetical protein